MSQYVKRILDDFKYSLYEFNTEDIPSLYIGGGTPSMLGADLVCRLVNGLNEIWHGRNKKQIQDSSAEITMEANPESCSLQLLSAAKDAGVNRLSLGIQTFNEQSRKLIGRIGEAGGLGKKLELAANIFAENFSVDLISGLPLQNKKSIKDDINRVIAYKPAHISLYSLIVEQGTPLADNAASGKIKLPSQDAADRLWIFGRDLLEESGYKQYEVSNFCFQGRESRHNLRYWRMENWLGLGPAASGTIIYDSAGTGLRFTNISDTAKWQNRTASVIPPRTAEQLDRQTLIKETMMMGFRLLEGPNTESFKHRFNKNIEDIIPRTIASWRDRRLMRPDKTALTADGLLLLDRFLIDAFEEL